MNFKLVTLAAVLFFSCSSTFAQVNIFDLIDILSDGQELVQSYNEGNFIEAAIKAIDLAIKTDPSKNTAQLRFFRDALEQLLFFKKNGQEQINNLMAVLQDLQHWDLQNYQPNTILLFNKAVDDLIESLQKQKDNFQLHFDNLNLTETCSKVVNYFNLMGWPEEIIALIEVPSKNQRPPSGQTSLGSANPMYNNVQKDPKQSPTYGSNPSGNSQRDGEDNRQIPSSLRSADGIGTNSQNRQGTQRPQRGNQGSQNRRNLNVGTQTRQQGAPSLQNREHINSGMKIEHNQLNQGKNRQNGQGQNRNGNTQRQLNRMQNNGQI